MDGDGDVPDDDVTIRFTSYVLPWRTEKSPDDMTRIVPCESGPSKLNSVASIIIKAIY